MLNLISGRSAAKIFGVTPQTISNWVALGKLVPVQKLEGGKMFLFDRAYIEALAAERKQAAQPAETVAA